MNKRNTSAYTGSALDSVRRIVQSLRYFSLHCENKLELSAAQLFVLKKLSLHPALSINELADLTFTHQSSVSVVVSRLCEKGMVIKKSRPSDKRKAILQLTDKGKTILKKAPHAIQEKLADALSSFPESKQKMLVTLLAAWVTEAGLDEQEPSLFFEERKGRKRGK